MHVLEILISLYIGVFLNSFFSRFIIPASCICKIICFINQKFNRVAEAGLACIPWPCVRNAGRVSLRVQQLDVIFEGKTKDNVFVTIELAILYQITIDNVKRAFYTLKDPKQQLKAFVHDVARSTIPLLNVDDLFISHKSEHDMSLDILRGLQCTFSQQYTGYDVLNVLVSKISPNDHVRDAMNEINACKRWKEAMTHKAESDKYRRIKMAEAESQTSYLHGVGTAKERDAIVKGMQTTIVDIEEDMMDKKTIHNVGVLQSKDVMDILLISQYYDTLSCISQGSPLSQKSMILHYGAGVSQQIQEQIADLFNNDCGHFT